MKKWTLYDLIDENITLPTQVELLVAERSLFNFAIISWINYDDDMILKLFFMFPMV